MSTTVALGGMTVTSTSESAADMTAALTDEEQDKPKPRVLVDKGVPTEEEPEKDGLSKAASELGKQGGKAAAKAREEKANARDRAARTVVRGVEGAGDHAGGLGDEADGVPGEVDEGAKADRRGNPRHDPQARVAQATREAKEARQAKDAAESRARAAEARAEALERARTAPAPQPTQQSARGAEERPRPGQAPEPPQEQDFESYADFIRATARHEHSVIRHEERQQQAAHQRVAAETQFKQQITQGFLGAITEAEKADPDFRANVSPALLELTPSFNLPDNYRTDARNWIADALVASPGTAPSLMLHLTEHDDDYQRIAALSSPHAVTWELAKLAHRPDAATPGSSDRREVSKAKPPARPVTGSPHTADQELDDNAPLSAHVRAFGQRELKNSRR